MKVISVRLAWHLFVVALLVLAAIAYFGDRAAQGYATSEDWVSHTREVEAQISLLRAEMSVASAAQYEAHADATAIERYRSAAASVDGTVNEIQQLTVDNPFEQANVRKLRPVVAERMQLIARDGSLPLPLTSQQGTALASESSAAAAAAGILDDMHAEEERLLASRKTVSKQKFLGLRIVLGIGLLCVLGVLIFAFRTLLTQLSQKEAAERSVRRLSAHILRVQDAERRRLARELHDGIGQVFAGLNMEVELLSRGLTLDENQKESFASLQKMVGDGLSQTRTISYLLHPPILDEFGFEQAAKWYVEGFSARSKIDVEMKFSQPFPRLSEAMELVLFRIIQESLTNVHRHSGSNRAEIVATFHPDRVNLIVRDFGKGIPVELLKSMEESSAGAGLGLGGMRERVAELGGHLTIESSSMGTSIEVALPIAAEEESFADGGPKAQPAVSNGRKPRPARKDSDGVPRIALGT
ncbi:MAG TPA: histidine kinase [Candidatus Acidoferrales bacterium]